MAGGCCTASNLPLWPLVHYRRDEGDRPEEVSRGLWPFLVSVMRYRGTSPASASAWCVSVLVIVVRLLRVPSQGRWSFDLLWPLFRVSRSGRAGDGGEGRTFTLRLLPLLYIYASDRRVLVLLAPCTVFYKRHFLRTFIHLFIHLFIFIY